jgi:hypothetical protein
MRRGDVQLALWAPPLIEVEPTRKVLVYGASAGPSYTRHPDIGIRDTEVALQALAFAEEGLRYNQAGRAVLDCSARNGAGSNGPMGRSGPGQTSLELDGKGLHVRRPIRASVTWPRTLQALRDQREDEPEVATARDLASAYHYLDYYGHVYGDPAVSGDWRGDRFVQRIASEVLELGGDPTLLEARTQYMAAGIRMAVTAGETLARAA